MKHQINSTDLTSFESITQIAGSFGKGENKSLKIRTLVTQDLLARTEFLVQNKETVVLTTNNLEEAILKYNEI